MDAPTIRRILSESAIGAGLSSEQLDGLLDHGQTQRFEAGALIFQEGAPADAMALLLEGQVEVFKAVDGGTNYVLATLGPGQCLGESAIERGKIRSAHVRAKRDCSVLMLDMNNAEHLVAPMAVSLARELMQRVGRTNDAALAAVRKQCAEERRRAEGGRFLALYAAVLSVYTVALGLTSQAARSPGLAGASHRCPLAPRDRRVAALVVRGLSFAHGVQMGCGYRRSGLGGRNGL